MKSRIYIQTTYNSYSSSQRTIDTYYILLRNDTHDKKKKKNNV
jgi:hypothetical protein